jgi:hypothetical protein
MPRENIPAGHYSLNADIADLASEKLHKPLHDVPTEQVEQATDAAIVARGMSRFQQDGFRKIVKETFNKSQSEEAETK